MSEVFEAKVRKIGNARGVIIPNDTLGRISCNRGGKRIQLIIPITRARRLKALRNVAGRYRRQNHSKESYEDRY